MFGVVEHVDRAAQAGVHGVHEGIDRPVALAGDGDPLSIHHQLGGDRGGAGGRVAAQFVAAEAEPWRLGQVLGAELLPHRGRRDLGAEVLGDVLDVLGELDLEAAGQVEPVLGLHQEGNTALAALAVHPDHGLVGAA